MEKMKIAYVTPEAVPFAKTGGLADVSGALPGALADAGHEVRLFMPLYGQIDRKRHRMVRLDHEVEIDIKDWSFTVELYTLEESPSNLKVYFIANEFLYDRRALYVDPSTGKDYVDNDDRFIVFCRAVLKFMKKLDWPPDILHAHDWQAALTVTYLKTIYKDNPFWSRTKTVFTIHNMGYQGLFPPEVGEKLGLDESLLAPMGPFEFWNKVNLMKSAIVLSDKISTVSPTYATEICSSDEFGKGLQGVLEDRKADLVGIINGVDYKIWSPQKDRLIPHKYIIQNLSGKKQNKLELLHKCGLPIRAEQPLIGIISRLDKQKGFDLIEEVIEDIMAMELQMVLLGTGDEVYHKLFSEVEQKYPDKFKAFLEFDNRMAHLIEAGSDIFLMPSHYEPCGLNQMYSLKYGTIPVVRKTGGLADTVIDWNDETVTGTGFVFEEYDSQVMLTALKRAVELYYRRKKWYKIVKQAMRQDFSWKEIRKQYIELYHNLLDN